MAEFNIEEYLTSLPEDIKMINISNKGLTYIPSLDKFKKLEYLDCSDNQIIQLDNLPNSLKILDCYCNQITMLPNLPNKLEKLYCNNNQINNNQITQLDTLHNIEILDCSYNLITRLPNLPTLEILDCSYNQITMLPNLPTLKILDCSYNQITMLPNLPTLNTLYCHNNQLPFEDIHSWNIFNRFKNTYYKIKYGRKLERYFYNLIKNKKQDIHLEILYSPKFKFYKQFADPITLKMLKN